MFLEIKVTKLQTKVNGNQALQDPVFMFNLVDENHQYA